MSNKKQVVLTLSLLAMAAAFVANLPELRRYIKIRGM
ncbi:DUF6893 family small protein [Pedosphaera parvula]|uniref:Uncharacterized protein n=1 Tax=Pedosphaera parvula (strain Ellin514) TaxID=320771 RepID=B9XAS1_PEDPL|nr:hypothetical protein Cflav_PD5741 [Pedosphaera parvula Ellin514]